MAKPHCFIAVFGELEEGKGAVESGVYCPNPKHPPSATVGDVLLLYCTASYPNYHQEAPGLGIVLKSAPHRIDYRWLPFAKPIPRSSINAGLDPQAADRFGQLHFGYNWLIDISLESLSKIIGERTVAWGRL
jgi:hypothetical protein